MQRPWRRALKAASPSSADAAAHRRTISGPQPRHWPKSVPAPRHYEAVALCAARPRSRCGWRACGSSASAINPTGKKRFQQALLEGDLDYILDVGLQEVDAGADILDVNVGYPGVDEVTMLPRVVKKLQSALDIPLQLDSSNPAALEAGLRVYNGKAAVNSVNGEPEVLERILPVVKKYGAAVVGLTLDSGGIPQTARGRVAHCPAHFGGGAVPTVSPRRTCGLTA